MAGPEFDGDEFIPGIAQDLHQMWEVLDGDSIDTLDHTRQGVAITLREFVGKEGR